MVSSTLSSVPDGGVFSAAWVDCEVEGTSASAFISECAVLRPAGEQHTVPRRSSFIHCMPRVFVRVSVVCHLR